ncbi:MAG: hypothetical protein AABM32_10410 [Chloroflexota bacterium]
MPGAALVTPPGIRRVRSGQLISIVIVVAAARSREIRAWSRPWAEVGDAPIPLDRVPRARPSNSGLVFDVSSYQSAEGSRDLARRVAGNDVPADDVSRSVRVQEHAIGIPAHGVVLDVIPTAPEHETDAEVIVAIVDQTRLGGINSSAESTSGVF